MKKIKINLIVCQNKLYIAQKDSGIMFIIACSDGLKLTTFSGDKKYYLPIEQVIDWHEYENKPKDFINYLKKLKHDYEHKALYESL